MSINKRNLSVFKGLILALLTGVSYSLANVIAKKTKNLHPGQLSACRFIAILAMCLPEVVKCGENAFGPKDHHFLLILRGIFGAADQFLSFLAYRYLPLGEAAVILSSVPVFVTVAARVFLREPCGIKQSMFVALAVLGIILTSNVLERLSGTTIAYTAENAYGFICAIGAVVFSMCRYIIIRKIKSCHHAVIIFNYGWVAVIETVSLTAIFGNFKWPDCGLQGLYLVILGILGFVAQTMLTMALQCEMAGPVSTMSAAADIGMAFLWQTLLFREIPNFNSIMGAMAVGLSVVFVGLNKWASSLPAGSDRRRFKWIL